MISKKRFSSRSLRVLAVTALSGLLSSAPTIAAEKLSVIASFSIIGDFAAEVGGDRIRLRTLVGPDGDAHVYQPKPSDAIALSRADLVLVNGLRFEGFMTRLVEASGTKAAMVELTEGANIINDPAGGHYHYYEGKAVFHAAPQDPHAWQSVANAKVYVANIAKAFCAADKEGCDSYGANAERYTGELSALDAEARAAIATIPVGRRVVVVAHNAFRYFERDYGLRFIAPQGLSTEAEASAGSVASIIREIRQKKASAVFAENISDKRLVTQIAREAGLSLGGVLYSDALSPAEGPAPTYLRLMRHNVSEFVRATSR